MGIYCEGVYYERDEKHTLSLSFKKEYNRHVCPPLELTSSIQSEKRLIKRTKKTKSYSIE